MKRLFLILCFALFCGVVFSGPVNAADIVLDNYPPIEDVDAPYEYVIYKDTSGDIRALVFYVSTTEYSQPICHLTLDSSKTSLSLSTDYKGRYEHYKLNYNGTAWNLVGSTSHGVEAGFSGLMGSTFSEFIESTEDIKLSDGTVVFPEPPAHNPTLAETIQAETTKAQQTILKAMTVIALCGVGCLALLTVLPILSRVFSRYR